MGREGKTFRAGSVHARAVSSPLEHARVGIIVPRYGRSAVARNRVKRRLRELVRLSLDEFPRRCEVVIRATTASYGETQAELAEHLGQLRNWLRDRWHTC